MKAKTNRLKFQVKLVPAGPKGVWVFLHFPFDAWKIFGTRGRVPVCGTINGFPFRSSLMPRDGEHILCINKEMQAGAKYRPGDVTRFVLQRDEKPRVVPVPALLKKALVAQPAAKAAFDQLAYSHRKEYVKWISEAKQAATVQRRMEKLIARLLAPHNNRAKN